MRTIPHARAAAALIAAGLAFLRPGDSPLSAQEARFIRGDGNGDGTVDLSDGVYTLSFLFLGSPSSLTCQDAADANDDGTLDVSDTVHLLTFLFLGGPPPAMPFPACGRDTTGDDLGCSSSAACPAMSAVGRILSMVTTPLEDAQLAALTTQDRVNLEVQGIEVSAAEKTLRSRKLGLAGYWVEVGGDRFMIGRDGRFEVDTTPGGTKLSDVPVFADEEDVLPVATIPALELVDPGTEPSPALLEVVTPLPEHAMNPEENVPGGGACALRNVAGCAPGSNAQPCCLDYDNPLGDQVAYRRDGPADCTALAVYNFSMSTCFIWAFVKPGRPCLFEAAFFPGDPSCWPKHKYRNCQNLDEDDFLLSPGAAVVRPLGSVPLTVRNNTPANSTRLLVLGPPGAALRLASPAASLRAVVPGYYYVLRHYDDTARTHSESVSVDFVAPANPPGVCLSDYRVLALGGGWIARTDVTVTTGSGNGQCWTGGITFSVTGGTSESPACDGGGGTKKSIYDYHGKVTVTGVESSSSNGGSTNLLFSARSSADASYLRDDRLQCRHQDIGCEWIQVDTLRYNTIGSSQDAPFIQVLVNSDGSYTLTTLFPLVEMLGEGILTSTLNMLTPTCTGEGSTDSHPLNLVAGMPLIDLKGTTDPADVAKVEGSFQGPGDDFLETPTKVDIRWEFTRS